MAMDMVKEKQRFEQLLQRYFGYPGFRPGQWELIEQLLTGRDVFGIMPTGAGKSICYELPALAGKGITLVISPLISLMKDQVDGLRESGIQAACLNSALSDLEYRAVIQGMEEGQFCLVYLAPERLESVEFQQFLARLPVELVAVDEAHCVSQWGHDFRPSYTRIAGLLERFRRRPTVAAFTATATPQVKEDVLELLGLQDPFLLTTGFNRENLTFLVERPAHKLDAALRFLGEHRGESGIIYCATRKTVEQVTAALQKQGFGAVSYHGGMTSGQRESSQEDFLYDRAELMVATNAFGMGIDKSNVRFVIHYNMPKSVESYYQEAGRAGRDGAPAQCLLLYSPSDVITGKMLIEQSGEDSGAEYQKLSQMTDYCNTGQCLRRYLLEYFGESPEWEQCGNCSSCQSRTERQDITLEAQKILSCVKRMGERFGSGMVISVLRGSRTQKVTELGFDKLSTHGIMKDESREGLREMIAYLTAECYLTASQGKFPVLALGPKAYPVLRGLEQVEMKRMVTAARHRRGEREDGAGAGDQVLFNRLRELRRQLAAERGVPPYIILSDATLTEMSSRYPTSPESLLQIKGVGRYKLDQFGLPFIQLIQAYLEETGITPPTREQTALSAVFRQEEKGLPTRQQSYQLYRQGLTVQEIAKERALAVSTIEGHLLDCLMDGQEMDYPLATPEQEAEILRLARENREGGIKAIREAMDPQPSYAAIRYVLYKAKFRNLPTA